MSATDQWDLLAALPFLAAATGIAYVAIVAAGGTALRLRRQQKRREQDALRRDLDETPWSGWLREINEQTERKKDRAERR